MPASDGPRLAPAPRAVPLTVRARLLGRATAVAWVALAFALLVSPPLLRTRRAPPHGADADPVFAALFLLGALALLVFSLRRGLRHVRLLREGRLALGTLVARTPTNVTLNGRPVMRMRFAVGTDGGARRLVEVRTSARVPLEDGRRARLLLDPRDPRSAVAWETLAYVPDLDATGAVVPAGVLGTALLAVPPAIAAGVLAVVLATAPARDPRPRPGPPAAMDVERETPPAR